MEKEALAKKTQERRALSHIRQEKREISSWTREQRVAWNVQRTLMASENQLALDHLHQLHLQANRRASKFSSVGSGITGITSLTVPVSPPYRSGVMSGSRSEGEDDVHDSPPHSPPSLAREGSVRKDADTTHAPTSSAAHWPASLSSPP